MNNDRILSYINEDITLGVVWAKNNNNFINWEHKTYYLYVESICF